MGTPDKLGYSRPSIRPVFAQLKASLPGHWFLQEVCSLTIKRERGLEFKALVRFRSADADMLRGIEVPVEWFPLLVDGSRWVSGRPTESLDPQRGYEIDSLVAPWECELVWDEARFAWVPYDSEQQVGPRKPAMVLHTVLGNQLWISRAEILRAFYFSLPQAIVCFLSGLSVHGAMSSSAFELWRPKQTGWVDQSAGIARIQRSRNLSSLDAKRIAKIILHEKGAAELASLWSWVQAELRRPGGYPGLPPLGLPFHRFIDLQAKWVPLTSQPGTGVPRRLATRIVGFRSDEPYLRLLEGSDNDNRQAPPSPEGGKPRGWGRPASKLRSDVAVSITDAKPDAELDELVILGAAIHDFAAEARPTELVAKELTITEPADSGRRRLGKDVESSSLGGPAERGTGAAPATLGADEHVLSMDDALLVQSKWIRLTLQQLAKECAVAAVPFAATWLPGPDAAYVFRWPANDTNYARKRSISRCFLVAQITLGGCICYLVDPERRVASDTFPVGVIRGKHDPVLQFEDLDTLAEHFETAHRKGSGWLAEDALPDHVVGLAIRRSALETEPERTRFSERSAKKVFELIEGKSHLPR